MNIIGQTRLLSKIDMYYTMQYLPKTLMFIGPAGCGKRTIAKYISEKFELDFVEIDELQSAQSLEDYLHKTIDTIYFVNLNKFTEKQQNFFLKALEEPSKSAYFILAANSEAGILNTILNRSIKYHLEPYSKEEIEQVTNTKVNDLAFKIFQTPGKLLNLTEQSFNDVMNLATSIVHNINKASYANALVVSTKINYKDLYNKIDFNLFFDAVEHLALEDYKNNKTELSLIVFKVTNQFKQYATQQNLIKEVLMTNYLTTLWEAVQ
jgi:DNA polymerase III delta prime subunit